jgi:pre-mRNA cleavage complex 2 protein Pcf11
MVAEDHADSKKGARQIYETIVSLLTSSPPDRILPILYVLDSVLKNVGKSYITLVEKDFRWIKVIYDKLPSVQKPKLQKVHRTWQEFHLFPEETWRTMGRCFDSNPVVSSMTTMASGIARTVRGCVCVCFLKYICLGEKKRERKDRCGCVSKLPFISSFPTAQKDGTLILPPLLRTEMQNILDDMQNDVNEIDKVSLERLADINPELLANIKSAAQEALASSTAGTSIPDTTLRSLTNGNTNQGTTLPSFISETRSDTIIARSQAFQGYLEQHQWNPEVEIADCQNRIQQLVENRFEQLYTKTEALQMTETLAMAVAVSKLMDHSWKQQQQQQQQQQTVQQNQQKQQQQHLAHMEQKSAKSISSTSATLPTTTSLGIDPNNFTNDGIKKPNPAVIGWLYEVGLPFVSSVDGRRFRTQTMLSQHLDRLFRRSQLEKSMARTEERGWYVPELVWTLEQAPEDPSWMTSAVAKTSEATDAGSTTLVEDTTALVPADETRDRCILCGIHFKMVFDNDQGVYCYSNCREIQVLNDDAAATESDDLLVHVTCWKGLGSPETITSDQTIQETLPQYSDIYD